MDGGSTRASGPWRGSRWAETAPRLTDLLIVLAVFFYNLPIGLGSVPDHVPTGAALLIFIGLCLPFLFRRRRPVLVFVATVFVAYLQLGLGMEFLAADIMVVLTLCSLTLRHPWYLTVVGLVASVVWLILAAQSSLRRDYLTLGDLGVLIALVVLAWTWSIVLKVRRQYIRSLEQHAADLKREQAAKERMILAEERSRIAREIHDVVSHNLGSVVALSDGAIAAAHSDPDRAQRAMKMVRETSSNALTEMRNVLGLLRSEGSPEMEPQPGITQLRDLMDHARSTGLSVEFRSTGDRPDLATGLDLTIYRIIQEALTNARKHAGTGSRVLVDLNLGAQAIDLVVEDDGGGRTSPLAPTTQGHGLIGMRERVASYGGTFEAGPVPGGGFQIRVRIPLGDNA